MTASTDTSPFRANRRASHQTRRLATLFTIGATAALLTASGCSKKDEDKTAPAATAVKTDKMAGMDHSKMAMNKGGDKMAGMDHSKMDMTKGGREIAVTVDGEGFHPDKIPAKSSEHLKLVFTRVDDKGCGTEVVIGKSGKKYALPLNKPVDVHLMASKEGSVEFTCGMNMLKGSIVVQN